MRGRRWSAVSGHHEAWAEALEVGRRTDSASAHAACLVPLDSSEHKQLLLDESLKKRLKVRRRYAYLRSGFVAVDNPRRLATVPIVKTPPRVPLTREHNNIIGNSEALPNIAGPQDRPCARRLVLGPLVIASQLCAKLVPVVTVPLNANPPATRLPSEDNAPVHDDLRRGGVEHLVLGLRLNRQSAAAPVVSGATFRRMVPGDLVRRRRGHDVGGRG
jgi:hypothetical protein